MSTYQTPINCQKSLADVSYNFLVWWLFLTKNYGYKPRVNDVEFPSSLKCYIHALFLIFALKKIFNIF